MPILTSPKFQQFVEQNTGLTPKSFIPSSLISSPTTVVPPEGSPIGARLGESLYDGLEGKQLLRPLGSWASSLGTNHGRAATLTALALGLGGAGYGMMTDRNPVAWGLAGAGTGALAGYGLSALAKHMANKKDLARIKSLADMQTLDDVRSRQEAAAEAATPPLKVASAYYGMGDGDPMQFIQSRIFSDPTLGASDKSMLFSTLQNVPAEKLVTLAGLLRSLVGAGVGYAISRFLLNLGGLGQAVGAASGAGIGAAMGDRLPRNAAGEPVDTRHDVFGRARFVT